MFSHRVSAEPQEIAFLLLPGFSMIGFAAMVDPLRWANTLLERECYRWQVVSPDGHAVTSSDRISLLTDASLDTLRPPHSLVVCAGFNPQQSIDQKLLAALRRFATQGIDLGGQDTGSYVLAAAGLLDGYRATIHWENGDSYAEAFNRVEVTQELFEIDRNRFSCSGGLSGLDMMLHLVRLQHGNELAMAIAEELIYHQRREGSDHQRMPLQSRYGISNGKLLTTVKIMQDNIEQPLPIPQLAQRSDVSERELERLFSTHLSTTPVAFYRQLRLLKARELLRQLPDSISDIAVRCGFGSPSHFSRSYHQQFGHPPKEERALLRDPTRR